MPAKMNKKSRIPLALQELWAIKEAIHQETESLTMTEYLEYVEQQIADLKQRFRHKYQRQPQRFDLV